MYGTYEVYAKVDGHSCPYFRSLGTRLAWLGTSLHSICDSHIPAQVFPAKEQLSVLCTIIGMSLVSMVRSELLVSFLAVPSRNLHAAALSSWRIALSPLICQPFLSRRVMKEWENQKTTTQNAPDL